MHRLELKVPKNVGVHFETGEVVGVGFDENLIVETAAQSYQADFVILATGSPPCNAAYPWYRSI